MPEPTAPVTQQASAAVAELAAPSGIAQAHASTPRLALIRTRTGRNAVLASLAASPGCSRSSAAVTPRRSTAPSRAASSAPGGRSIPSSASSRGPGSRPRAALIPPGIVAGLWLVGLRLEALFQLGAWSTALLSSGLKALARRPRPAQADAVEIVAAPLRGSSFPSGHVLTYVGVYGFLAHLVEAHVDHAVARRAGVAALAGLVGLVGPSRVQQGHHWPSDVLGSYLVGLPLLALYIEAYRWTKARLLGRRA